MTERCLRSLDTQTSDIGVFVRHDFHQFFFLSFFLLLAFSKSLPLSLALSLPSVLLSLLLDLSRSLNGSALLNSTTALSAISRG